MARTPEGKDYRVLIRVKNANLLRAIEAAGYKSISALCRQYDLSPKEVGELINMKTSPTRGKGRQLAETISIILDVPIFRLFSENQMEPLAKNTGSVELSMEEMLPMLENHSPDPLQQLIDAEQYSVVEAAMEHLSPREIGRAHV